MNPEIKAEWVAALRSGEYRQTKRQLRYGDNFCCLGVLCDLRAKKGKGKWLNTSGPHYGGNGGLPFAYDPGDDGVANNACLPMAVWKEAGLRSCGGLIEPYEIEQIELKYGLHTDRVNRGLSADLTYLNDHGLSFHQIADVIEKYL